MGLQGGWRNRHLGIKCNRIFAKPWAFSNTWRMIYRSHDHEWNIMLCYINTSKQAPQPHGAYIWQRRLTHQQQKDGGENLLNWGRQSCRNPQAETINFNKKNWNWIRLVSPRNSKGRIGGTWNSGKKRNGKKLHRGENEPLQCGSGQRPQEKEKTRLSSVPLCSPQAFSKSL